MDEDETEEWMNAPMGKIKSKDIIRDTDCQNCGGCGERGCCEGCYACGYHQMWQRIEFLAEEMDKLTEIVKIMSDHIRKDRAMDELVKQRQEMKISAEERLGIIPKGYL